MGADKGIEDDLPAGGKDDSFRNPSNHGALSFGTSNDAAFTDDEGFHMWTFKLTAAGSVELETDLHTANLDTVMYLYKRESASTWGSYTHRNDDANDETAASRLAVDLDAGEYRVLVKAYKATQRGQFSVLAECTGSGCPTSMCGTPEDLPSDTGYGGSCGNRIAAIYQYGSVDATQSTTVSLADRCNADPLQRRAVDFYASYFSELEPDAVLAVEVQVLGGTGTAGGALVSVTDGGDESSMSFLFDTSDELVVLYQSNQSPDVQFFCKEPSAATVSLPNVEDCVSELVFNLTHDQGDEDDVDLTEPPNDLPTTVGPEIEKAMQRYSAKNGTSASTELTVVGATWEIWDGNASRVTIEAAGKPATSYMGTSRMVILEAPTGKPAALVCQ